MNSTEVRNKNGWHKGFVERKVGNKTFLSVVFSWDLPKAMGRAAELLKLGISVEIGGPAAKYAGIQSEHQPDALSWHNENACSTSTGCVYGCDFCIVPLSEGYLREKPSWEPKRIVCDNNPTACSRSHFDKMIDSLKNIKEVDIQGVSCLNLTRYHADRFAELDPKVVRLAWDKINYESHFMAGWTTLRSAGFPASRISVYVLIGFHDTQEDALYRLEAVRRLGSVPFPMRYQPLDTLKRNSHVGENWTHRELVRYCRYWSNLRITGKIPFAEFHYP